MSFSPTAEAAPRDLTAPQPASWVGLHTGLTGALLLGGVGLPLLAPAGNQASWRRAPAFERATEQNFSPVTAKLSDVGLMLSIAAPIGTLGLTSRGRSWENSLLIYGETVSLGLFLNSAVKMLALRARPFTHSEAAPQQELLKEAGNDANYSFYSGHTALSFTSASSGSLLFSAVSTSEAVGATHWGASLALASFTGVARIQAGRHYPSDVIVGALFGVGVGVGVPLLHGVRARLSPVEVGVAAGGTVLGAGAALLLPSKVSEEIARFQPALSPVAGGALLSISQSIN